MKILKVLVAQLCPTLCNAMDCRPSGSSVLGIPQARIPEWVAISFSRGSSLPQDRTWVSRIADGFFTIWATRSESISINLDHLKKNKNNLLLSETHRLWYLSHVVICIFKNTNNTNKILLYNINRNLYL